MRLITLANLVAVIFAAFVAHDDYREARTERCTVIGMGRIGNDMRLDTAECGVLKVDNTTPYKAHDLYAGMELAHTYDFTVYGWQGNFLAVHPNITHAKEIG
jgi:hypothetical protein